MCRHVSSTFIHILLSIFWFCFCAFFCFLLDFSSKSFGWLHYHLYAVLFFEHIIAESAGRRVQQREGKGGGTVAEQREREMKKFTLCFVRKKLLHFRCYETWAQWEIVVHKKKRKPEKAKKNMPKRKGQTTSYFLLLVCFSLPS